jgi:hypothetical protein
VPEPFGELPDRQQDGVLRWREIAARLRSDHETPLVTVAIPIMPGDRGARRDLIAQPLPRRWQGGRPGPISCRRGRCRNRSNYQASDGSRSIAASTCASPYGHQINHNASSRRPHQAIRNDITLSNEEGSEKRARSR